MSPHHLSAMVTLACVAFTTSTSLHVPPTEAVPSDPKSVARLVGDAFFKSSSPPVAGSDGSFSCPIINHDPCGMMAWGYGGALIVDGMYQAADAFGFNDWYTELDGYLDGWLKDKSSPAYFMKTNTSQPFDSAVGDYKGLYPIGYLQRALHNNATTTGTDISIAWYTAQHYILGWPHRLPDGTFSRTVAGDWPGQKGNDEGSFVWGDDQTMGTVLIARMAALFKVSTFASEVTTQQIGFASRLRDPVDGLNYHGYNNADGDVSCCKWSRANGWGMLGHAEALDSMQQWPEGYPNATANTMVKTIFQQHAAAAKASQAPDGRWHQLLNDTSSGSFLETSTTAMFVSAIARGIRMGVLDKAEYSDTVTRGWAGLVSTILTNGTVTGVCCGTGIQPDAKAYYQRSTFYGCSGPGGAGAVLYAATELAKGGYV